MKVQIAVLLIGLVLGSTVAYYEFRQFKSAATSMPTYFKVDGPEYADISLKTHKDTEVSWKDFAKQHRLVYFGYASCPDICPIELLRLSRLLKKIDSNKNQVKPIFITVDPGRDTVKLLSEYVPHFHPYLVGLTGEKIEIDKIASAFKIFYEVSRKSKGNEFYLVDHTSAIFYVNPNGEVKNIFRSGTSDDEMEKAITQILNS